MFERDKRHGGVVLRIKGAMSVFVIERTYKEIVAVFAEYDDLTLDLRGVNDFDISGLQLLYSVRKTARFIGKTFSIDGASDAIIDIFNRVGLNPDAVLAEKSKIENKKNGKEISNGQNDHDR